MTIRVCVPHSGGQSHRNGANNSHTSHKPPICDAQIMQHTDTHTLFMMTTGPQCSSECVFAISWINQQLRELHRHRFYVNERQLLATRWQFGSEYLYAARARGCMVVRPRSSGRRRAILLLMMMIIGWQRRYLWYSISTKIWVWI